jgi:hypothetical protein
LATDGSAQFARSGDMFVRLPAAGNCGGAQLLGLKAPLVDLAIEIDPVGFFQ